MSSDRHTTAPVPSSSPFKFLELPPELRIVVYDFVLTYDGVNQYFKRRMDQQRRRGANVFMDGTSGPSHVRNRQDPIIRSPGILRANRRISGEALSILRAKPLVLACGTLFASITDAITAETLRHVQYLVLCDSDSPSFGSMSMLVCGAHLALTSDITNILGSRHSLKCVKLRYHEDKMLGEGRYRAEICFHWCWCMLFHWSRVANVQEVEVDGWMPLSTADELRTVIKMRPFRFLSLPPSIRRMIYDKVLDWGDTSQLTQGTSTLPENGWHYGYEHERPGIFGVNRQINREATEVLRQKPLSLRLSKGSSGPKPTLDCGIHRQTLKIVRYLRTEITGLQWLPVLRDVKDYLHRGPSLQRPVVCFEDRDDNLSPTEEPEYPTQPVISSLNELAQLGRPMRSCSTAHRLMTSSDRS